MSLLAKRIILLTSLFVLTGFLTFYVYSNDNGDGFSKYIVSRDQSDDYDALFDDLNFKSFTIEFNEEVFNTMIANMQSHFTEYGDYIDNTTYPVNITYKDNTTEFEVLEVGFRTKSTTSRNLIRTYDWRDRPVYHQTTFQLQFNETFSYVKNTNVYEVLNSREVFNLDQLNFEYSQIYSGEYDKTMISEAYTHYLYEQADVLVANASYCVVYLVIGEEIVNYGLFSVIEPIDTDFVKKNFDSDLARNYGDLYKVTDVQTEGDLRLDYESYIGISDDARYTYSLRNNSLDGLRRTHNSFEQFILNINDFDYFKENYEDIIDMDMFIRYLAISFLVGNSDDIRYNYNNYYLYFDVYTDKVTLIPFDLDNTLGFGKSLDVTGFMADYSIYYNLNNPSPLIDNVFRIDELRTLYSQYILEFIDEFFNYNSFQLHYNEIKNLYEYTLINENHLGNKVFGLRNIEWYFDTKVNSILNEIT